MASTPIGTMLEVGPEYDAAAVTPPKSRYFTLSAQPISVFHARMPGFIT
jgi:hypothetical protein